MFAQALLVISTLSSLLSVTALPNPNQPPERRSALPSRWFHKRDHPVHALFKRDDPLPEVGSPEWQAKYPPGGPTPTNIPQAWLDALHAVQAAGHIPNIAPATTPDNGNTAVYPADANAGQEPICSASFQCRHPEDIWDAPDGMIGLSVDDGPVGDPTASGTLYDFLKLNNQKVTHFMIGSNILYNPTVFLRAFSELDDDIACHTWTHPHMSLLTNEQLVSEFGWTMQIIHDSTGGRVPRYWRPPYGDADNRVRAVAKYVFGLTTVVWNQDSEDWTQGSPGGTTLDAIQTAFTGWLNGPRTPGLIVLEHEITGADVTAFMNMYPLIAQAAGGTPWIATSVAGLFDGHATGWNGDGWYLNSDNDTSPVEDSDIIFSNTTTSIGPSGTQANAVNGTHTGTASSSPTGRNGAESMLSRGVVASGALLAGLVALAL